MRRLPLLAWAVAFLVVALAAALFGSGLIASTFASIAQIVFLASLALVVVSLVRFVPTPPTA